MLTKSEKNFIPLFIGILTIELITGSLSSLSNIHFVAKPALLIGLLFFFCKHSDHLSKRTKKFMVLALGFSLLGDVLLMFVNNSPHFFTGGLIAFLLAHIFYILVFKEKRNPSKKPVIFLILLFVYAGILYTFLKDGLNAMRIPVIIYMLVILTMSLSAFLRQGKVNSASYYLVFAGAVLFMISDSILALNKFYQPLQGSNISIMATYAVAQLCIVMGIIKQQ